MTGAFHQLRRIVLQQKNFCLEMARVRVQLKQRSYSPGGLHLQKQLQILYHTHPELYSHALAFVLSQMEIYYNIHWRFGLLPYLAPPQVLLPNHILHAAAAAC